MFTQDMRVVVLLFLLAGKMKLFVGNRKQGKTFNKAGVFLG